MKKYLVLYTTLALFAITSLTQADTHTWSGAGISGYWSLPANWQGNNPPSAAESAPVVLIFPSGASRLTNTNNLSGLLVHGLTISGNGYTLHGSGAGTNITLTSSVFLTGFFFSGVNNVLGSTLNISLAGLPALSVSGNLLVQSRLLGTGGFVKAGTGTLTLNSQFDNTFAGAVNVTDGVLNLHNGYPLFSLWIGSTAVPRALTLGGTNSAPLASVVLLGPDQIADGSAVTINPTGMLKCNGNSDAVGSVTMTGGYIFGDGPDTGNIGTILLNGGLTALPNPNAFSDIEANLSLNGTNRTFDIRGELHLYGILSDGVTNAGFTKIGSGELSLIGATNTFRGAAMIDAGILSVHGNRSLGATNSGTVVASGAQLHLFTVTINDEPLTLNGNGSDAALLTDGIATFSGPITFASASIIDVGAGYMLTLSGALAGPAGFTKQGLGTLKLSGLFNNTYAGSTLVSEGTLSLGCGYYSLPNFIFVPQVAVPAALAIGGGNNNALVQLLANSQLSTTAGLRIDSSGVLDLNSNSTLCGPLTLDGGSVQSSTGTLTLNGDVNGLSHGGDINGKLSLGAVTRQFSVMNTDIAIYGIISGAGSAGITKIGPGALDLENLNTFSGPTVINEGIVIVTTPTSLGTGAGGVTANPNGQLWLFADGLVIANTSLTLNGNGLTTGGLYSYATNCAWTGPIALASDSIAQSANTNYSLTLSGVISGSGGLRIGGRGVVTISGGTDNLFQGALRVTGTNHVFLNKSAGAVAVPSALIIGNDTDYDQSADVVLRANNQIANSASVTIYGSGVLDLGAFTETIGPLAISVGEVFCANQLTLNGDVTGLAGFPYAGGIYGNLSLGGQTRTFNIAGALLVTGTISDGGGNAGLIKTGIGELDLMGPDTYSGLTTVGAGMLSVQSDTALGATTQGTVISNNAILQLIGSGVSNESLTLNSGAVVEFFYTNAWTGPITLAGNAGVVSYFTNDTLTCSGVISGPGGLTVDGPGVVKLGGGSANTYGGNTYVHSGLVILQKTAAATAIPYNLIIGTDTNPPASTEVRLNSDSQIINGFVGSVQVRNSGYLNLNNHRQTLPQLTLSDHALVDSGANGLLTLGGDVAVSPVNGGTSLINGQLSLGGADRFFTFNNPALSYLIVAASIRDGATLNGFTARGGGILYLTASNSFSGTLIADRTSIWAQNNFALGATNGGTVLTNTASLTLSGLDIAGEALTISGAGSEGVFCSRTNSWSGPVQLLTRGNISLAETDTVFTVSGPISGPGDFYVSGPGTLRFSGPAPNTFSGTMYSSVALLELNKAGPNAVSGPLVIVSGVVRLLASSQIGDAASVNVLAGAWLDVNGYVETIGDFFGAGRVRLDNGLLAVGGTNPINTFSGIISGSGGTLYKNGSNTLVLTGHNTYNGDTRIFGGTLLINGGQPLSTVYVNPDATLGGNGTIGKLYGLGGTVSPGASPGRLTVSGNAILNSATKVRIELNGTTPGTLYDQLDISGDLAANDATLEVVMGFAGAVSNQYTIVSHTAGTTSTIFDSLPPGGIVTANNGATFRINYAGGDGNDTVLTQISLPAPPQLGGIAQLGNGTMQLTGTGVPGVAYTVEGNFDLNTTNWLTLGTITAANQTGLLQFIDTDLPHHPMRFYRFRMQ